MKFIKNISKITSYAREELLTIIKDPAILLIFIIANLVYPIIYSIAYQPEQIKDVSVAVIDYDNSLASSQMCRMIDATDGIKITYKPMSLEQAKELFYQSKVHGIITIPKGLEKDVTTGTQTSISIYADASYFLIYKQIYSATVYAYRTFAGGVSIKKQMIKGQNFQSAKQSLNPVNFQTVDLYNPKSSYGAFVMPPLLLIILQQTLLIGIGILGGTRKEIIRYKGMTKDESEQNTQLLPFILGKALAYFVVFMIIGLFSIVMIHHWFGYPHKTSYFNILALYVPYIVANIFLGMSISVFFKRRENALLFMVFLSVPVLFLSGATWPIEAVPSTLHKIFHIFPSTVMVPAYIRLRTMGAELHHVAYEFYFMLAQCVIYFILAVIAFKYVMKDIRE